MDAKQTFDCPARPRGHPRQTRTVSLGESGDNREKYAGPIDTLMTPTLKAAIVQNLESFSPLGGKGFTAWRQACPVRVQLEPLTRFSLS